MTLCAPLEAIYRIIYERRLRRYSALASADWPCKIISVGNLTLGGTGKTPAVQWLAGWLHEAGWRVAVVARGYRGQASRDGAVVSDGTTIFLDAVAAGDEPVLHARNLPGVAVVIGQDREAAVTRAVADCRAQVVVLDDAFQYWSLHRDFDLVLLDTRRPFHNFHLLPCGRLREPPVALARADAVLLTRADRTTGDERDAVLRGAYFNSATCPVFLSSHQPCAVRDEKTGEVLPLSALRGRPLAVVSAIADNEGFSAMLKALGAVIVSTLQRRDHHRWRASELQMFATAARRKGASALVVTEKDLVKISLAWTRGLPLWSVPIRLAFADDGEAALKRLVLEKLALSHT